jgi:hypothetical protein
VSAAGAVAALVLLAGLAASIVLLVPAARQRRLGILHPTVVWLALEAVFFGVGSLALAIGEGRTGPAIFLGAAVLAAAIGTRLAGRYGPFRSGPRPPSAPADRPLVELGRRGAVPAVLALLSVAVLAPTLIASGLPLLSPDATSARAALVGLAIQGVRVAVPALASVLLLEWLAGRPVFGRSAATWLVIALLVAGMVSLASRYLVAELVAGMVLAWLLTGRSVTARAAVVGLVVGLIGFVAVGVLRAPNDFSGDPGEIAAQRTISRLVLVQPRTLDALMTAIPADEPFFLGLTWLRRLGPAIGRDDIPNLGYWIYPEVVDEPQDVPGYAAPGLIGEAWANFGPAGIVLFGLFGVGLEALAAWVATHRARVVDLTAGALAIVFAARTHALGLLGLAVLLGLLLGWWLLAGGVRAHRTEVPAVPDG